MPVMMPSTSTIFEIFEVKFSCLGSYCGYENLRILKLLDHKVQISLCTLNIRQYQGVLQKFVITFIN